MASGADILLIEQLIKGYQVGAKNPAERIGNDTGKLL